MALFNCLTDHYFRYKQKVHVADIWNSLINDQLRLGQL